MCFFSEKVAGKSECRRKTKELWGFDRAVEEVSQVPAKAVKLVALKLP